MKKQKKETLSSQKKKTWHEFSKFIRLRDARNGYCTCVTCGAIKTWKTMQAGHFISGRTNSVLFEEKLVHAQCPACNIFKHGNYVNYTLFMLKKHTKEEIEQMIQDSKKIVKFSINDLKCLEKKYKELNRILEA
jgi:hypothetical protein